MAEKPLHNVIIVVTGPDQSQVIANMTIPEPGALVLRNNLAGVSHTTDNERVKQLLKAAFGDIDFITVNAPTVPVEEPPKGEPLTQLYAVDLDDLADGRAHVARNETGEPVIEEGAHPALAELAAILSGEKHLELVDGKILVVDGPFSPETLRDGEKD